jgi:hypothetical protein
VFVDVNSTGIGIPPYPTRSGTHHLQDSQHRQVQPEELSCCNGTVRKALRVSGLRFVWVGEVAISFWLFFSITMSFLCQNASNLNASCGNVQDFLDIFWWQ